MSLRKCHTFAHNLRAIQPNSSHRSIRQDSNHRSRKCQWDMFVQIPEFPSLPRISSFQHLKDQLSMFCPCASLWHLWFLWIVPCSLYSFLSPQSWTMTCSVCPCQTIAPPSKHPSCGFDDPFSLSRRERVDRINSHGILMSTSTRVTRLGITNSQTELRLLVRHDFQARILEYSQAIRVEDQMFLKFLSSLISSSNLFFIFFTKRGT